jgi:DNA-binding response OmpR family regulator
MGEYHLGRATMDGRKLMSSPTSEGACLLIVDDDAAIRRLLRRFLEAEGFRILEAEHGEAFRTRVAEADFDLVLLDIGLAGENGFDLLKELSNELAAPVIFISGKGHVIDRVVGLELGADDYITKPFELREVLARVRSVLRRARPAPVAAGRPVGKDPGVLRFAGWSFDRTRRIVMNPEGALVELTTGEFNLLAAFLDNPNRPLTRDQLMDRLKGTDWTPFDRSIDAHVSRLRKKMEADPRRPSLIKSVRGVGYVLAAPVESG